MAARTAEACDRMFEEHLNAGDTEGLVALYEPDAALVNQDGSLARGAAAIRAALAGFVAMKPSIRMHVVKTVRVGDDLAVLYNDWALSAAGPDGTPVEMVGKAIEVVRRQVDGTWRFAVDDPFGRG
jgi:uncharacterized protein (TIGR02246 family)